MGFLGFAVPEQVHPDDLMTFLLQKVDPAGLAPVALERRREAMHQQDGEIGHRGRVPPTTDHSTGPITAQDRSRSSSVSAWPVA